MQQVYILCGLPGSGKSTWAKKKVEEDELNRTIIVNKDAIQQMLLGKYEYVPEIRSLVRILSHISIWEALDRGYDVIIDDCHIKKEMRKILLAQFRFRDDIDISLIYFSENERNLEYRMLSPKGVSKEIWSEVIENMKKDFEPPTQDELGSEIKLIVDPEEV